MGACQVSATTSATGGPRIGNLAIRLTWASLRGLGRLRRQVLPVKHVAPTVKLAHGFGVQSGDLPTCKQARDNTPVISPAGDLRGIRARQRL